MGSFECCLFLYPFHLFRLWKDFGWRSSFVASHSPLVERTKAKRMKCHFGYTRQCEKAASIHISLLIAVSKHIASFARLSQSCVYDFVVISVCDNGIKESYTFQRALQRCGVASGWELKILSRIKSELINTKNCGKRRHIGNSSFNWFCYMMPSVGISRCFFSANIHKYTHRRTHSQPSWVSIASGFLLAWLALTNN